jgi:hypothetical protein
MAINVGYMVLVKSQSSCYDTRCRVSKGLWTLGGLVVTNANENNAIKIGRHLSAHDREFLSHLIFPTRVSRLLRYISRGLGKLNIHRVAVILGSIRGESICNHNAWQNRCEGLKVLGTCTGSPSRRTLTDGVRRVKDYPEDNIESSQGVGLSRAKDCA